VKGMRGRAGAVRVRGAGIAGSLGLHLVAGLAFLTMGATKPRPPLLAAYRVELIAGPEPTAAASPAVAAAPPAPPAPAAPTPPVRAPGPPRPAPAPAPRTPPAPVASRTPPAPPAAPRATPIAPAAAPATPRPTVAAPTTPAATTNPPPPGPTAAPGATPGAGPDPTTVRTAGVEFPFPGYLRNLVAQIYRRWRPPSGNELLQAEVFFLVHRDGTMSGLQFIRRSGSFAFDLEAQGAVEAAVRAQAFGTLPEGYGADVLPVSFFFSPGTGR